MEVARPWGCHLLHARFGSLACRVFYQDREQAFADLGLSPKDDAADPGGPPERVGHPRRRGPPYAKDSGRRRL